MENGLHETFWQTHKQAGAVLSQKGNRLKLIEGILFCVTLFIFGALLETLCVQISVLPHLEELAQSILFLLGQLLFWLFQLFVTAPLLVELLEMAAGMARGRYVSLAELFAPFYHGKTYRRNLRMVWSVFWKALVFAALPSVAFADLQLFFPLATYLPVLAAVVTSCLPVGWLLLALRGFAKSHFLLVCRMPWRQAKRANAQIAGKSFSGGLFWWLCYLPQILLGFLTVGILLIADVLPRMMVSYFLYCGRMTHFVQPLEEPDDE